MVFQMPPASDGRCGGVRARACRPRRVRRLLLTLAAVLAASTGALLLACGLWTDWLWYASLGYSSVLTTRLGTQAGLFAAFGGGAAALVGGNIVLAYRIRPPLSAMSAEQYSLERWRCVLARWRGRIVLAACLLTAAVAGATAAGRWRTCLAWLNATPFGARDPQFHLDDSFYTFDLPWYRFLTGFAISVLLVALLGALLVHYLYGALRTQGPGRRVDRAAQCHLGVLLGALLGLKAVAYWLDRFGLAVRAATVKSAPGWTGLRYTDANALLPAKTLLCCAAVACALLLLSSPLRRSWSAGLVGVSVLAFTAVLTAVVYPAVYGHEEEAQSRELPFVQRNIAATRAAFGLGGVEQSGAAGSAADSTADSAELRSIRLVDPALAGSVYGPVADDHGTLLGVRGPGAAGGSWAEQHVLNTRGSGLVRVSDGPTGDPLAAELPGDYQRQVYYGTGSTTYALTGVAEGGVSLGNPLTRAAYALRLGAPQLLTSGAATASARLLYNRTPAQRVAAAAPWLTLDGDPYPTLVGGRIDWVLDGYTTSDSYPYASRGALGGEGSPAASVSYVRDAVKATVDAYSGKVTLYQWDTADPVLRTWMKAFPGTVRPRSVIPAALLPQLRYPRDLFTAQEDVLARYHVTDPALFLSGRDVWQPAAQPPSYATVRMPDRPSADYSLTGGFTAASGGGLTAYLAADSAPGPDYGTLRMLRVTAAAELRSLPEAPHGLRYGRRQLLPVGGALLDVQPVYATTADGRGLRLRGVLAAFGSRRAFAPDLAAALRRVLKEAG